MSKRISFTLSVFLLLCTLGVQATPLRMDYLLTDIGGGNFQYDFTLTLDNNDGSWTAGQEWDWIIFGDNSFNDLYNGFDPDGSGPIGILWSSLSFNAPITALTDSGGGHTGPTLNLAANGVAFPGWNPTAVGEALTWSGTSSVFIPNGEMRWSAISARGGALFTEYQLAHQIGVQEPEGEVPEPGTITLLGLALAGLGYTRRKTA